MRLSELEPRWIHPNLFVFRCPHCREVWLTCKDAPVGYKEQDALFAKEMRGQLVVGATAEYSWTITDRSFEGMTVTPSIDASKARHWHGHITAGAIQ